MIARYLLLPLLLAQSASAQKEGDAVNSQLNLPMKTLGGTQFWTDIRNREGLRIQQNSVTGHCRVLDPKNVRVAWGTKSQCLSELDARTTTDNRANEEEPAERRHIVVLLHGLMRTSRSMKPLEDAIRSGGMTDTLRFSYASSRASIDDHASALQQLLEDLPTDTEFSFVGHSMGNIVVRRMLGSLRTQDPTNLADRFKAMVMLGPPNQGAAMARRLSTFGLYGLVAGKGGKELGREWKAFQAKLAVPNFPFVIIAGDVSDKRIQNPLISKGNDYVVTVEEADLEGRQDLVLVPEMHTLLMNHQKTQSFTVDFLNETRQQN